MWEDKFSTEPPPSWLSHRTLTTTKTLGTMNTKDLSPAFLTSLVAIFVAALMIASTSTVTTVLGWLILLAALGLNVFSSLVSIQRAKGGPLPSLITEIINEEEDLHTRGGSRRIYTEEIPHEEAYDSEPDTEAQPVVAAVGASHSGSRASEEKIFRARAPRPHTR